MEIQVCQNSFIIEYRLAGALYNDDPYSTFSFSHKTKILDETLTVHNIHYRML